jgi:NAD(P)-dependent dehydrogenase (short-subunit alcohol dehydrogenase family)
MKAAVIQYTKYAATNLAVENIRVNSISPGAFPSSSVADKMPGLWESLSTMQPLERIGNPDELQGPIIFLASNASSYVTGHNLVVDGGWTIW